MSEAFFQLQKTVAEFLRDKTLVSGLGTDESPCSIAAINLALTGKLTDSVPECMSAVIGNTIIVLQDAMPDAMRNSDTWRTLLPLAAGSGRQHEAQRLTVLLDWLWSVALPQVQPVADANGFGGEWAYMCREKSAVSAKAAEEAAERLRVALEEIASGRYSGMSIPPQDPAVVRARKALEDLATSPQAVANRGKSSLDAAYQPQNWAEEDGA